MACRREGRCGFNEMYRELWEALTASENPSRAAEPIEKLKPVSIFQCFTMISQLENLSPIGR
jgi:hypothetical protein